MGLREDGTGGSTTRSERKGVPKFAILTSHSCCLGGNLDSRGDPLPPAPPPPSDPTPQGTSPPRSPVANSRSAGFSRGGSERGAGPASWEPTWESGTAPPALTQEEGAWPLRVTLLQSSF